MRNKNWNFRIFRIFINYTALLQLSNNSLLWFKHGFLCFGVSADFTENFTLQHICCIWLQKCDENTIIGESHVKC